MQLSDRTPTLPPFRFTCPLCHTPLEPASEDGMRCPAEGTQYSRTGGIWCFLTPARQAYFQRFIQDYETVRREEGRGSIDPAYYRALPFEDISGLRRADWRIRARSFQAFMKRVILPLEKARAQALKILDLGAGNGWLSYQLAKRGHSVAAVDLLTNSADGLETYSYYDAAYTPVQAEFNHLPFTGGQADLVIFNASLHYSTDTSITLGEALRVLKLGGQVIILDTPIYHSADSGAQMVREREAQFLKQYGFPSNAIPSENYLTERRLKELAQVLDLCWQAITPFYGLSWALRPWKARLLGRREPARFLLLIGQRCLYIKQ